MRKRIVFFIIIISFVSAFFLTKHLGRDQIELISCFFADDEDNFYYIEDGITFYKIDKQGNILVKEGLNEEKSSWYDILVDVDKNIYIPVTNKYENEDGEIFFSQHIKVYGSDGSFIKNIFESKDKKKLEDFKIFKIQNFLDKVAVFSYKNNVIKIELYDFKTDTTTLFKTYEFAKAPTISDIAITENGGVYYTDINYELYCLDNIFTNEHNKKVELDGIGKAIFKSLSTDDNGNLYMNDVYGARFIKYDEVSNQASVIYNKDDIVVDGIKYFDLSGVKIDENNIYSMSNTGTYGNEVFLFRKDVDTGNYSRISEIVFSIEKNIGIFLIMFVLSNIAFLLIYAYCYYMKNTKSILVRQVMVSALLMIVAALTISIITSRRYSESMLNDLRLQLYNLSSNIKYDLNVNELKAFQLPAKNDPDDYKNVHSNVNLDFSEFYNMYPGAMVHDFYYNIMLTRAGNDYILYSADMEYIDYTCGMLNEYMYQNSIITYSEESENKDILFEIAESVDRTDIFCVQSIRDDDGDVIGKIEVGVNLNEFDFEVLMNTLKTVSLIFFIMICILFVLMIMLKKILRGLKELKRGAIAISETDWDTVVDISTDDELEDIGNSFNRMTNKIRDYFGSIEKLNKAYRKFVPNELFDILEKENVLDVNLGDEVVKDISVMVVQTKNFYSIRRKMSTQESFNFLNNFFGIISGIIKKSGGIIEEYRGAGLSAIYQNDIDKCIECSLYAFEKLNKENIDILVYIQSGDIMVGIVGDDERMEITSVSEVLNTNYYIQKIAENNDINMIITGATYNKIAEKEKFNLRLIGRIENTDTNNGYVELYDIIDAYPHRQKANKIMTLELFEQGVNHYINGDIGNARNRFIDVLKIDKDDKIAQSYVFMCDKYRKSVPENWAGFFEIL